MRAWLGSSLRGMAEKCDPQPPSLLQGRAGVLVAEAEKMFSPFHGEAKRHYVYAKLLKTFPTARKRDVGMAIERACQEKP